MYEPYSREWIFDNQAPTTATMQYPGMLLWGLSGGICSAALTLVLAKRAKKPWTDSTLQLIGAWTLTSSVFCGLYFLWGLWPF